MDEVRESFSIIEQALDGMPAGTVPHGGRGHPRRRHRVLTGGIAPGGAGPLDHGREGDALPAQDQGRLLQQLAGDGAGRPGQHRPGLPADQQELQPVLFGQRSVRWDDVQVPKARSAQAGGADERRIRRRRSSLTTPSWDSRWWTCSKCDRCGRCEGVCPIQAITVLPEGVGDLAGAVHLLCRLRRCLSEARSRMSKEFELASKSKEQLKVVYRHG